MARVSDTMRFIRIRLVIFVALSFASVNSAAAQDTLLESGYKSLVKLFSGSGQSGARNQHVIRLRNDGRPFPLHILPDDRSAITARLNPPTRYVEIYRGCKGDWCHVRFGLAAGWIRKDRFDLRTHSERQSTPPEPQSAPIPEQAEEAPERREEVAEEPVIFASIPLPARKELQPPPLAKPAPPPEKAKAHVIPTSITASIEKPEIAPTREQPVKASLRVYDIAVKKYSLTRMEGLTFLPVREDRTEEARILGAIPFFADDVEAAGLCVNEWCLVKRGDLRGWIRQENLSDAPQEQTPVMKLRGGNEQAAVPVYDKPDAQSQIASYISTQTRGIRPVGACDHVWCRVQHQSTEGWIQSKFLARQ